jgi:gliding motility-associated-like protein
MKSVFVFILLFFLNICVHAQNKDAVSSHQTAAFSEEFMDEAKTFYDWKEVERDLAKKLKISVTESEAFLQYVFWEKYDYITNYYTEVNKGTVTKNNAFIYWVNKFPFYEDIYINKYLPALKSHHDNSTSSAKQGNVTVLTGGASCNNLDFSTGDLTGWSGKWNNKPGAAGTGVYGGGATGTTCIAGFYTSGLNRPNYVHEICTAGTDRQVPISRVPPGHTYSVRLGSDSAEVLNASGGNSFPYNHQFISNTFMVTPSNNTISYWYAVALSQSIASAHGTTIQPFFRIRMYDSAGVEITCAHYDVNISSAATIGFSTLTDPAGTSEFYYKDWSQVLIPLIQYVGQPVTITFESCDCANGGHFGYAYLAVDCAPFPGITVVPFPCLNTNTTLTAPPGVAGYSWVGPGIVGSTTSQVATVNKGGTYSVSITTIGNSGYTCAFTIDTSIAAPIGLPVASFTATTACAESNTQFTDASTITPQEGTLAGWNWTFGDGGTSTSGNPMHPYTNPGTYPVNYTITTSRGCTASYSTTVNVNPIPTSVFSTTPVCQGSPTIYTNTSTGGVSYNWHFGDGTGTSTSQSPTYTYTSSGNFVATLSVTNSYSCTIVDTNTVVVNPYAVPSFTASTACLGSVTSFTNNTTPATAITYTWNFGETTINTDTSSVQNPSYTYSHYGPFATTLTVSTTSGCASVLTETVNVLPVPKITFTSPTYFCWKDSIKTTLINTPALPGITYNWTNTNTLLGLGASGTGIPPSFIAPINSSTINISGIIQMIPALNGCIGPQAYDTINIKPTPYSTHSNVDFCTKVPTGAITFTATPTAAAVIWTNTNPGTIIGLNAFNGIDSITNFTPVATNTVITAVIKLQDSLNGCVGPSSTFSIAINPDPIAKFYHLKGACNVGDTKFIDESTVIGGTITKWGWDMKSSGSYTDATSQNPSYNIPLTGYQPIGLMVTSNFGCISYTTELAFINISPTLNFSFDTAGCTPFSTVFKDSTYLPLPDSVRTWTWNFGNGSTIVQKTSGPSSGTYINSTSATYTNSSNTVNKSYPVTLTAISDSNCIVTITKHVTVYPQPKAAFTWGPNTVDILTPTVHFYTQAIGASGANAIYWDFGDVFQPNNTLANSTALDPTHVYSDEIPYTYEVTQSVENIYGCKDIIIEPVTVYPVITFYIPNAFTPNKDGKNDSFKGTGMFINDTTYDMWIYDRWGNTVFHSNSLEFGWDGYLRGTRVQEDVYVWKVSFKDDSGKAHSYDGTVTLLK